MKHPSTKFHARAMNDSKDINSLALASAWFWRFSGKKRLNAHGFAWELRWSGMLY